MFFDGKARSGRKVDLRGTSKAEETKQQILDRAKEERAKRQKAKREAQASRAIQAWWRGTACRRRLKAELRAAWCEGYGKYGERAGSSDVLVASPYLGQLVRFADANSRDDVLRLAAALRLILTTQIGLEDQMPGGSCLRFCSEVAGPNAAVLLRRTQRLLELSLAALDSGQQRFHDALSRPRLPPAVQEALGEGLPASAKCCVLVEALICLGSPAPWALALGSGPAAAAVCSTVLRYLLRRGAAARIAALLHAHASMEPRHSNRATPAAEALAAPFAVHLMQLQPLGDAPAGLLALLCVPLLWCRCPSLASAGRRLAERGVAALHRLSPQQLLDLLPQLDAGGKPLAALALLGNLLQVAPQFAQEGADAGMARLLVAALDSLLSVVPLALLFPEGTQERLKEVEAAADLEDEDEADAEEGVGVPQGGAVARLGASTAAAAAAAAIAARDKGLSACALVSGTLRPWWDAGEAAAVRRQLAQVSAAASWPGMNALAEQVDLRTEASLMALQRLCAALMPHCDALSSGGAADGSAVEELCCLLLRAACQPCWPQHDRQRVLVSMALSGRLVPRLWFCHLRQLRIAAAGPAATPAGVRGWMLPVALMCCTMQSYLHLADVEEMYTAQLPLPLTELHDARNPGAGLVALLKAVMWQVVWIEGGSVRKPGSADTPLKALVVKHAGLLLGQLYDRNSSRAFAEMDAFYASALTPDLFKAEVEAQLGSDADGPGGQRHSRAAALLRHAPCLVPFHVRALIFQQQVRRDREGRNTFLSVSSSRFVCIRRQHILEDGFARLGRGDAPDLRGKIRVVFMDEYGMEEPGIDGGGIFKEFLEEIVKIGFGPELGLWKHTHDNRIYPDPTGLQSVPNALQLYHFLGRIVGKALYEGLLLDVPFAAFFLKKLRFGPASGADMNDLPSLDPQLHRHLQQLRNYSGDLAELCLTMTITDAAAGTGLQDVELLPGGRSIAVTDSNRLLYIHLVAQYRLSRQIRPAVLAFLSGFRELITIDWVCMFNEEELGMLLCGATTAGLDLEDMRQSMSYGGGYDDDHPVIQNFWQEVALLQVEQQRALLKFITGCSRPPLLGFDYLEPKLCIRMSGHVNDPASATRLPSASTCANLLKLPPYPDRAAMREKLLIAISSATGFSLS